MDYAKLTKRIEYMIEYETDEYFVNINLDDDLSSKLFDYQHMHLFNLITGFRSYDTLLDGSDTGTGKSYTTIALCKHLGLRPLILCPKVIVSTWMNVCKYFGVLPIDIVNYDIIKRGRTYDSNGNPVESKYIKKCDVKVKKLIKGEIHELTYESYEWKLPRDTLLVFDEAHKFKNKKSYNGQLLLSAKGAAKILMLSATICDTPKTFQIFGYMLGFYKTVIQGRNWINHKIIEDNLNAGIVKNNAISKCIYPLKGSRMSISELGDKFPKNQISAECYNIDVKYMNDINRPFLSIGDVTPARQKAELAKIELLVELTKNYVENGYNVVIFVNYSKTIDQLSKKLKCKCILDGRVESNLRDENINNFQNNQENVIICNIETGGVSIGLHDLYGRPRVSLISPPSTGIILQQALGRICRAGSKSPALQRLIYCSNTFEEKICQRIKDKIQFLSQINDDDLIKI